MCLFRRTILVLIFYFICIHLFAKGDPAGEGGKKLVGLRDILQFCVIMETKDTVLQDKTQEDTLIFADDERKGQQLNGKRNESQSHFAEDYQDVYNGSATVYPNPSKGEANIVWSNPEMNTCRISVFNSQGVLLKEIVTDKSNYRLDGLPRGAYFIEINRRTNRIYKRFSVE